IKEHYQTSNKKKYERLIMRLLWRDYFRFMLKKYPNIFFKPHTIGQEASIASGDRPKEPLEKGSDHPAINAFIHKMQTEGKISYEYRDILAAYMLQEWNIDHLTGACFFEEHVLDYAPATTYGYWLHTAGAGTSSKDNLKVSWEALMKKNYQVPKPSK